MKTKIEQRFSQFVRNLAVAQRNKAWKKFRLERDSNPWPLRCQCRCSGHIVSPFVARMFFSNPVGLYVRTSKAYNLFNILDSNRHKIWWIFLEFIWKHLNVVEIRCYHGNYFFQIMNFTFNDLSLFCCYSVVLVTFWWLSDVLEELRSSFWDGIQLQPLSR